jgi:hypothetical protein
MAAIGMISAYRANSLVDLISVAQIIACGKASLRSIGVSMQDQLCLEMTLKPLGHAIASGPLAEQNRQGERRAA